MSGGTIKLNPYGVLLVCCVAALCLLYRWHSSTTAEVSNSVVTLKRLLMESIRAAELGGAQVAEVHRSERIRARSKGLTKEGAVEPVTDADLRSHWAISVSLNGAFKGHGIKLISEEHGDVEGEKEDDWKHTADHLDLSETIVLTDGDSIDPADVTVWIDPLDATQEFTENLLQYVTVMVCVAVKGRPVIGVIHKPFESETVWALVGHGLSRSLRNYINRAAKHSRQNDTRVIIVSRSHAGEVKQTAKQAFGDNVHVIPAGGAGYKVLQVISGQADAYVHVTLIKKWDICAGNAILDAVGGRMTTLAGDDIDYADGHMTKNEHGLVATAHQHRTFLHALKLEGLN